ncbi:formate dehydrogenase accessory sulfurtransferase FdhD [Ciceribacter sp. RN22]|uniref:formate dehydrogenase accessory sulfurtransferase FdhD n=1 Tax=Ciceribacter sp. RN22 TaxID=2954932 RepID=UPI002092ACE3|nr:formate dehydrogenase accessory sulfurtransferase FdhD [Ciceribacter sp. RN22]MCO6180293.1 formate dehydrogenase accessory sulfurtransferase FdhD [Ciceribacter sp. RN22]
MTPARLAAKPVPELVLRAGAVRSGERMVPEEVPIAFSYGGTTHAVMMATPADLEDFAVGFSLTEGVIADPAEIVGIEVVDEGRGIDVQVTLADPVADALRARRRHMAGPVGCGLCGIESIDQALRPVRSVRGGGLRLRSREVAEAVRTLGDAQSINRVTHAVHGAGFYVPGKGLVAIREDVGRHNALDKLCGAVVKTGYRGEDGVVAVTSRLSVEMVQKAASLGSSFLLAVSAPTLLAIETAEKAGMTLVAVVRGEDFEIFTHADRILSPGAVADVA